MKNKDKLLYDIIRFIEIITNECTKGGREYRELYNLYEKGYYTKLPLAYDVDNEQLIELIEHYFPQIKADNNEEQLKNGEEID